MGRNNLKSPSESSLITGFSQKELEETLSDFSPSCFEGHVWDFTGYDQKRNNYFGRRLHFEEFISFPGIESELKTWLLGLLIEGRSPFNLTKLLYPFKKLVGLENFNKQTLFEITQRDIFNLFQDLIGKNSKIGTVQKNWMSFRKFYEFYQNRKFIGWINAYNVYFTKDETSTQNRDIDDQTIRQLDRVFWEEPLELPYRLVYWLLRLIPNRIGEVLSIPFDCLNPVDSKIYRLTIPTFKQSGPYPEPEIKNIYIGEGKIESFLIELISKQQKFLLDLGVDTEFLIPFFIKEDFTYLKAHPDHFNKYLNKVIGRYNIRDSQGNIPYLTSHQFRHRAVSERIRSGSFSLFEITQLSGHHTQTMADRAYTHLEVSQTQEELQRLESEDKVSFKGRVIPGNDMDFILKRPYSIELPGYGVCSDVRNCNKDPFVCLSCSCFVPENKDVEVYKKLKTSWEKKLQMSRLTGEADFEKQCLENIRQCGILIQRLENE